MSSFISPEAQEKLIVEYRDAALAADPQPCVRVVGNLALSSLDQHREPREPNPYVIGQLLNMVIESRPRERCISFVR